MANLEDVTVAEFQEGILYYLRLDVWSNPCNPETVKAIQDAETLRELKLAINIALLRDDMPKQLRKSLITIKMNIKRQLRK
ncbi:MAG: hypothetical protein JWN28_516 [Candidatus Saccharibacteria bacterium]|jgi:hypothetical protein|nr:hypothetical protein [Candidatus Saccharibacteria bacterium]